MKLRFYGKGCVPAEQAAQNIAYAKSLGLPFVAEAKHGHLAVCGGGHSIRSHVEEIRNWPGDVWLIGSSYRWWKEQGISGTFFSIHPSACALDNIAGVEKALVATCTNPAVIDKLRETAAIELFDLVAEGQEATHGPTTATAAPYLAVRLGYTQVSFFGCESCYEDTTHLYMNAQDDHRLRVKVGDESFLTGAEFLMQAEFLAMMIRAAPRVFKDRSGGLLSAFVRGIAAADGTLDYDLTHISRKIAEDIGYVAPPHPIGEFA